MVSDKLNKMGFSCVSGEVVTTSYSSALYLRKENVTGKVYILAEAGTTDELELAGLHVIGGGPDGDSPIDFIVQDIEAAIVSHDTHVESVKLSKICTYVSKLKDDKLFIVTNMVRVFSQLLSTGYFLNSQNILSTHRILDVQSRIERSSCLMWEASQLWSKHVPVKLLLWWANRLSGSSNASKRL